MPIPTAAPAGVPSPGRWYAGRAVSVDAFTFVYCRSAAAHSAAESQSYSSVLRRFGLAAERLARALGDVLPVLRIVVRLRLARAGMRARTRGAVILAGLGDAVALVLVDMILFRGDRRGRYGKQPGNGRGNEGMTLVHGDSSWVGFAFKGATGRLPCIGDAPAREQVFRPVIGRVARPIPYRRGCCRGGPSAV